MRSEGTNLDVWLRNNL